MARQDDPTTAFGRTSATGAQASPKPSLEQSTERAVEDAKGIVETLVTRQKHRALAGIADFSSALHKAAASMERDQQDIPARYTHAVAGQIDRLNDVLQKRDWNGLVSDAAGFARRQPVLFIAGAVAAGFLLSRFLKSTPDQESSASSLTAPSPPSSESVGQQQGVGVSGYEASGQGYVAPASKGEYL